MNGKLLGTSDAAGAEAIRGALERALASPEFQLSARMSQLLRYLVEATLANRGAELKETVLGVEVFGRPPDYDPKIDPVVRKEARRLRQKLQEYYQGSGAAEALRIDLPKGGYVPAFGPPAAVVEAATSAPAPPPRKRLTWVLSAGVGLVFLTGSVAVLRTYVQSPLLAPQALTGNSGTERSPAFSPDGKQIAFVWDGQGGELGLYIQALHSDSARRVTSSEAYENYPAWSPDGHSIAFLRRTARGSYAVILRGLRDGVERTLAEIAKPDHVDWSPDGRSIAVSDGLQGSPSAIVFLSTANGGRQQITIPAQSTADTYPRFSPDGGRLAFLREVAKDVTEVYVLDLKTRRDAARLTNENRKIEGFAWAPDGESLMLSLARGATARSLWRLWARSGTMERIAAAGTGTEAPAWGQGALAYVERRQETGLWRVRADAPSAPEKVASSSNLNTSPAISPDGSQVAFRSARSGTNEIWLTGLLESRPTRLTWTNGALTGSPNWSPDGQWIAFDSRVAGNSDILLAPAKGGPWRKLTDTPSNEIVPRWSRDGQWVYFGSDRGGRWQVWKQRPSGGAAEQVTWGGGYVAAESPDGAYVYFTRGPDEQGLYRMPAAGGVEELILPGFAGKLWGNWAVAAKGVYYLDYPASDPSTRSAFRFLDLASRQSREVYRLPKHPVLWDGGMALSADEKWLVFAELEYLGSNIQVLEGFR